MQRRIGTSYRLGGLATRGIAAATAFVAATIASLVTSFVLVLAASMRGAGGAIDRFFTYSEMIGGVAAVTTLLLVGCKWPKHPTRWVALGFVAALFCVVNAFAQHGPLWMMVRSMVFVVHISSCALVGFCAALLFYRWGITLEA